MCNNPNAPATAANRVVEGLPSTARHYRSPFRPPGIAPAGRPGTTLIRLVSSSARRLLRGRSRLVVACGVLALALLWWWWPSINPPAAEEADVAVITDDVLRGYDRPVGDRLREAGRAVRWLELTDVCDGLDRVEEDTASVDVVVLAVEQLPCPDRVARWAGSRPGGPDSVLLVMPSEPAAVSAEEFGGVGVVDVSRLTGATGTEATMPCQWWDQRQGFEPQVCTAGQVTVRDGGALTEQGADRVARAIVAQLP
jgi:hypothetical protein